MKKITVFLMGLVLVFSLAACSNTGTTAPSGQESSVPENSALSSAVPVTSGNASQPDMEPTATNGDTLVVYFSATGNTEEAAGYIAEITGGDLFALEPADPYTSEDLNWTNEDSRVVYEHDNPDARAVELVADTVDNWEDYDTVFIGYPICGGLLPGRWIPL